MRSDPPPRRGLRWLRPALAGLVGALLLIQLVPYGRAHANPPVGAEPDWDSAQTRRLFYQACGDCHSHETRWPWYSWVAPVSWLVAHDVEEARSEFNVSDWNRKRRHKGDEAAEELADGEMPLPIYRVLHPEARLSASDRDSLLRGLEATFGREDHD